MNRQQPITASIAQRVSNASASTARVRTAAGPSRQTRWLLLSAAMVLTACATPVPSCPPVEPAPVATVAAPPAADERSGATDLAEAIRLYDATDYPAVIQKLQSSPRIWQDIPEVQISAYKYLAFSYCVTGRRLPCRRAFESLLKLQPDFQLARTEVGHPIWGPEFSLARREAAALRSGTGSQVGPRSDPRADPRTGLVPGALPVKARARPDRRPDLP